MDDFINFMAAREDEYSQFRLAKPFMAPKTALFKDSVPQVNYMERITTPHKHTCITNRGYQGLKPTKIVEPTGREPATLYHKRPHWLGVIGAPALATIDEEPCYECEIADQEMVDIAMAGVHRTTSMPVKDPVDYSQSPTFRSIVDELRSEALMTDSNSSARFAGQLRRRDGPLVHSTDSPSCTPILSDLLPADTWVPLFEDIPTTPPVIETEAPRTAMWFKLLCAILFFNTILHLFGLLVFASAIAIKPLTDDLTTAVLPINIMATTVDDILETTDLICTCKNTISLGDAETICPTTTVSTPCSVVDLLGHDLVVLILVVQSGILYYFICARIIQHFIARSRLVYEPVVLQDDTVNPRIVPLESYH